MADQIPDFIDGDTNISNRVNAAWLNDVNDATYRGITVNVKRGPYDAAGDWNGSTGTDDSAAIRSAVSALVAVGRGTLVFPPGRYRIFSDGVTTTLAAFSNMNGITIEFDGAELVVDRTFTGSQTVTLFSFTACDNISFKSPIGSCTQTQPANEKTSRGPHFATYLQGCKGISSDVLKLTSFRIGWYFLRTNGDAASYISRGIDLGVTYATTCGYPLLGTLSGWGLKSTLITDTCGRSYFVSGGRGHEVTVISKNHEGSVDCLLASDPDSGVGNGMQGVELNYINKESTTADNSINCVRIEVQNSDVVDSTFRNIHVNLDIETGASAWMGFGYAIGKVKADDTADATDRGHILENLSVSGTITGGSANQRTLNICGVGTWGTGEFLRNFSIKNLRMGPTVGQPNIVLSSLQDIAVIENMHTTPEPIITGNTTGKIICIGCESASALTSSAADTSRVDYISCKVGSLGNQSIINKNFHNTYLSTTLTSSSNIGCRERFSSVPIGSVAYASMGTAVNHANGTIYVIEVSIPKNFTATGIAILNGGTVGTNNRVVGLYDSGGSLLANSALAGAVSAGANAFQSLNFTATKLLLAGKYLIALQANGNTDNARMVAVSTFIDAFTISQGGAFGTMATISPVPTAVVADVGPIAYVY